MNIDDLPVSRALIVGDMHGNLFAWERTILPAYKKSHADIIIQVGDFGYGWAFNENREDVYLLRLDELLEEAGAEALWLDGNHENFSQLATVGAFPNRTEPTRTSRHTTYLPRGFVWEWSGIRCMSLGGAYSIDKPYRKSYISWWPEEELTDEDVSRAMLAGHVDVLFAHDAIAEVQVPGLPGLVEADPYRELCAPNRARVSKVARSTGCETFVHGHLHVAYNDYQGLAPEVIGLNNEDNSGSCIVIDFAPESVKWEWAQTEQ